MTHLEKALAILKLASENDLPTNLLGNAISEIELEIMDRRRRSIEKARWNPSDQDKDA